jgi:hypothetical protein
MQCQAAFGLWKSEWTMQGDPKVIDYLNKGLRASPLSTSTGCITGS